MLTYQHTTPTTKVMSIWDPAARRLAATLAAQGQPFALYFRGVCAILGKGESSHFTKEIVRIKGESRAQQPLATIMLNEQVVKMVDATKIPAALRPIFTNAEELTARLGSLCFVRLPIQEQIAKFMPTALISRHNGTPVIQNWDPRGHNGIHLLIKEMMAQGIQFPAGTSMNQSGKPEIVDQPEGIAFCKQNRIPLFLTDARESGILQGSYSILSVQPFGMKLERDGNIPGYFFTALLSTPVELGSAKAAKYPQLDLSLSLLSQLNPYDARMAMLMYLQGWSELKIRSNLKKVS